VIALLLVLLCVRLEFRYLESILYEYNVDTNPRPYELIDAKFLSTTPEARHYPSTCSEFALDPPDYRLAS
jgi:hypothetical protein